MSAKYNRSQAKLSQGAADELIGYLHLLIEELQLKYCHEETAETQDCIGEEQDEYPDFDDNIPF